MILQKIRFFETIAAPPSKSEAIRALILSALADRPADILLASSCTDIDVCASALRVLGAQAERTGTGYRVTPRAYAASDAFVPDFADCATALRLIAPVYRALTGKELPYTAAPRLQARIAAAGGLYGTLLPDGSVSADVSLSSQTASGELIALSVRGGVLRLRGRCVSRPYFDMTRRALQVFGADLRAADSDTFPVHKTELRAPDRPIAIGGDYSSAAWLLLAGILGPAPVTVTGLEVSPAICFQGDSAIVPLLRGMGAKLEENRTGITAYPSSLHAFRADAADIPDLVPPLCAAACACTETSTFAHVGRLRHKESDRVAEILAAIRSLGGFADCDGDTLTVHGPIRGGVLPHTEDHRIAMLGVLLSLLTEEPVETDSLGCVGKSYPEFIRTFRRCP